MLYQHLLHHLDTLRASFVLIGANGQFGRSLLAQMPHMAHVRPAALCDTNLDELSAYLLEMGYADSDLYRLDAPEQVEEAQRSGGVVITGSTELALAVGGDVFIEATGVPALGVRLTQDAIRRGMHVINVNKEADTVAGPALAAMARERGQNYVYSHGDQPRNLIELIAWARLAGLEIVAAGKSSEYDFVYDPEAEVVTALGNSVPAAGLQETWAMGERAVSDVLKDRVQILSGLSQHPPPDYCEMALVANSTGLRPSGDVFHYPFARIDELADIYAEQGDGGILEGSGVLDVFNLLRRPDEPSFAGGVFIVVTARGAETWEVLRGKGHVVSRSGTHACVYLPYHLLGLETPISILDAVLHPPELQALAPAAASVTIAMRAQRDFRAGDFLEIYGPHHVVDGVVPMALVTKDAPADVVPYYLAAGHTLTQDVPRGELISLGMVDVQDELLVELWQASTSHTRD